MLPTEQPQPQLLLLLLFEVSLGIFPLIPAKNSALCGGAKISIGKSKLSKNSQGLSADTSSHSCGIQKPLDNTERLTSLNNLIIVNKPIVIFTSDGSNASSPQPQHCLNLISAPRDMALDSTKTNGSEFNSLQLEPLWLNKSVEMDISVPIEPNNVTFLVKILFAWTLPIIVPSASLNTKVYTNTYFNVISQKPFLNGLGSLSDTITFFTLKFSIETVAALEGGSIISPSCIVLFPRWVKHSALAGPNTSLVRQSCCLHCNKIQHY